MNAQAGDDSIHLSVPSDPACMAIVRAVVEKVAGAAGFSEEETGQIVLAVDEACANVIRHQYEGRRDQRIELDARLDARRGCLEFLLRDYGPVRDPALFRGRELAEVRPGGLGLHIIRKVMDEVEFTPAQGGGMQLRLCKKPAAR